jgi:hypothetical protein
MQATLSAPYREGAPKSSPGLCLTSSFVVKRSLIRALIGNALDHGVHPASARVRCGDVRPMASLRDVLAGFALNRARVPKGD